MSILFLSSCYPSSIEQFQAIKKPATVYSKHKAVSWWDDSSLIIQDSAGALHSIYFDADLNSLIRKYSIGDTIK